MGAEYLRQLCVTVAILALALEPVARVQHAAKTVVASPRCRLRFLRGDVEHDAHSLVRGAAAAGGTHIAQPAAQAGNYQAGLAWNAAACGCGNCDRIVVGNFLIPSLRWQRSNPWDLTYSQVEQAVPYLIKGVTPPPDVADPSGVGASSAVTQTIPTPVPTTIAGGAAGQGQGTAGPGASQGGVPRSAAAQHSLTS